MERKKMKNRCLLRTAWCVMLCVVMVAALATVASAATDGTVNWSSLRAYGDAGIENTRISVQNIDGINTVILPSTVSPSGVPLVLDMPEDCAVYAKGDLGSAQLYAGTALDLTAVCSEGNYYVTFYAEGEESDGYTVRFLFSANISTLYLISEDPVNEGREWVESSVTKANSAAGNMVLQNADGTVVYQDALTQIKGRGNSTWSGAKKPYQIKLDSKTDLLQTGNDQNKSKTWVLLANYYDPALMRNTIGLGLGSALGMETNVESTYIDLYYDGEYRGCYLLAEKVEVGSGRVSVTDMEDLNEEANPDVDLEELPIATGTTANGAFYTYCEGMASPADVTGGYLLEMEFADRVAEEVSYFCTTRGTNIVVKSPEYASREEMDYIASFYQDYEDAVYNNGMNPRTGKRFDEYVDLRSSVDCYLVNEFTRNADGFKSSTFLYKDAGEETLTMGPLWDFDLSLGDGTGESFDGEMDPEGLHTAWTALGKALQQLSEFQALVKKVYNEEVYPMSRNVLLGGIDAVSGNGALHSVAYYRDLLSASAVCDNTLWHTDERWSDNVDYMADFIARRGESLLGIFSSWASEPNLEATGFHDVSPDMWFAENVMAAANYGLMQGIGSNLFDPMGIAKRSQVAQTIFNMSGAEAIPFVQRFTDVEDLMWYTDAVTWAADQGIILGYTDGTFRPEAEITRQELIVLLYRYIGAPAAEGDVSGFADAGTISEFAVDAMRWAVGEGILVGRDDNTLNPLGTTSRAELATILVRFYESFCI